MFSQPLHLSENRQPSMIRNQALIKNQSSSICFRLMLNLFETLKIESGGHLHRVGCYAHTIAQYLGMSAEYCEMIKKFAPLHDIGKIGISTQILSAKRALTRKEYDIVKKHTTLGYKILQGIPSLHMAAEIAHSHHERYDGTGYPQRLRGHKIPLAARIVALADVYDALRSRRPYKESWDHTATLEQIREETGTHFDPSIVTAFLALTDDFQEISFKHHNENCWI